MWHYPEIIEKFPRLAKRDQDAFLHELVDDLPHGTPNGLLIACVRGRSWLLLQRSLEVEKVRSSLWSVIDDLESFSNRDGTTDDLFKSLPSRLTPEEGRLAMVYPSSIKSWAMTERVMEKGALPGKEVFLRAFDAYLSNEKTFFEYKLITNAVCDPEFDWQGLLAFAPSAGYGDILKRAKTSSKMGYYALAFALMDTEQKGYHLSKVDDLSELERMRMHAEMPSKWQDYLSMNMKSKLLTDLMGL
jgi:hypothetical protein